VQGSGIQGEKSMNAQTEFFLAAVTGVLLVWWKLRQTIAYIDARPPRVILPRRPRPAPRKIHPLTDINREAWGIGIPGVDFRDDSEAAA
jgi:hypothetical protein